MGNVSFWIKIQVISKVLNHESKLKYLLSEKSIEYGVWPPHIDTQAPQPAIMLFMSVSTNVPETSRANSFWEYPLFQENHEKYQLLNISQLYKCFLKIFKLLNKC